FAEDARRRPVPRRNVLHCAVDMPVFFYIDPDFADDPKLQAVDTITLSYTFFEAKEGLQLPLPGYMAQ
ncbi:hypothetical protein BaRGS_00024077, partial [Batillaria attramentaria]